MLELLVRPLFSGVSLPSRSNSRHRAMPIWSDELERRLAERRHDW